MSNIARYGGRLMRSALSRRPMAYGLPMSYGNRRSGVGPGGDAPMDTDSDTDDSEIYDSDEDHPFEYSSDEEPNRGDVDTDDENGFINGRNIRLVLNELADQVADERDIEGMDEDSDDDAPLELQELEDIINPGPINQDIAVEQGMLNDVLEIRGLLPPLNPVGDQRVLPRPPGFNPLPPILPPPIPPQQLRPVGPRVLPPPMRPLGHPMRPLVPRNIQYIPPEQIPRRRQPFDPRDPRGFDG